MPQRHRRNKPTRKPENGYTAVSKRNCRPDAGQYRRRNHTSRRPLFQTANGYWAAWYEGTAAVLPPDAAPGEPCFWVEGAHDIDELVAMLENGEFDDMETFDGEEEEWHEAGHTCGCGCAHGHEAD